ncbi:pancreatic triacylglycerol lipase [Megalopta genalis]|uniref:pancreatic triacylglycerol lipase n=1 Tax=Megalopta genalis TaxID=115081 RepID=UPI003FD143E2
MKAFVQLGFLLISGLGILGTDLETLIENEKNDLDPGDKLVANQVNEATSDETWEEKKKDLRKQISFYLYTKANPTDGQQLYVGDVDALKGSNFNFSRPTKFLTHGWINTVKDDAVSLIRDAYLKHGDYNIIGIDWSKISFGPYVKVSNRVLVVGKYCSSFIDFLQTQGLDLSRVAIIGHCLGGHVAGLSARYAKGKVDRVVALDPALPHFALTASGERCARNDAKYVEVVHTNGGVFGFEKAIGDVDFYPNGGGLQAGCKSNTCSHLRAYKYFAESINSKVGFEAVKCPTYSDFRQGACNSNDKVFLGGPNPNNDAKGVYFFDTNEYSPFAKENSFGTRLPPS